MLFHTFLWAKPLAAQPVTSFSPKDEIKWREQSLSAPEMDLLLRLLTNVSYVSTILWTTAVVETPSVLGSSINLPSWRGTE